MRALVERLTANSFATMLLRKADWHDADGMAILLEAGADPNRMTRWASCCRRFAATTRSRRLRIEARRSRGTASID